MGPALIGRVLDRESRPISGAQIELRNDDNLNARFATRTDADGAYRVDCASAKWSVTVEAPGFVRASHTEYVLPDQPTRKDFVLEVSSLVSGTVVDPEGRPVADAALTTVTKGMQRSFVHARTQEDGGFRIDTFPGSFSFEVEHPRFQPRSIATAAPISDLKIVLDRGSRVVGVVVDAEGQPLAKVAVSLSDDEQRSHRRWQTVSGPDGRFELDGLPAGSHWVSAHLKDLTSWRVARRRVELVIPHTREVTLTIERGPSIRGRVLDRSSRPVGLVRVLATPEGATPSAGATAYLKAFGRPLLEELAAFTNAKGEFEIKDANERRYELSVDDRQYVGEAVAPASPGDRDVVLIVEGRARVKGRVIDEARKPIKRFFALNDIWSSSDGSFELDVPLDFENPMWVHAQGYVSTSRSLELKEALIEVGDIVLAKGRTISGRVLTEGTGAAIAGARVNLPHLLKAGLQDPAAITGSDGSFTVSGASEGETHLVVEADGFGHSLATIPENGVQAMVYLRALGVVTGSVRQGGQRELIVYAHHPEGLSEPYFSVLKDGKAFRFELPPGRWTLRGAPRSRIVPVEIDVVSGVNRHVEMEVQ